MSFRTALACSQRVVFGMSHASAGKTGSHMTKSRKDSLVRHGYFADELIKSNG